MGKERLMRGLRVLIVEDDPVSATLVGLLVHEEGHEVCGVVAHGEDVPQAVASLGPDVVLMDLHLAGSASGALVARNLLRLGNVPVIAISGSCEEELSDIVESGALGFIRKPVSREDLRKHLGIATRRAAAHP